MMEHKEEITALLTDQQYEEGVDGDGKPLRKYTPATVLIKSSYGTYRGFTDLHNTGAFQSTTDLSVDEADGTYSFNSPARTNRGELKSQWLNRWQGADVMKLTEDKKPLVWKIIFPTVIEKGKEVMAIQ
jgi:hypothetical protein